MTPLPPERVAKMMELAAACERAGGPDRELDVEIASHFGFRVVDEGHPLGRQCYDADHRSVRLPAYTASLDAAMTLVPEGWHTFMATEDRHSHNWSWSLRGGFGWKAQARAATPALALCAAALRAGALPQDGE